MLHGCTICVFLIVQHPSCSLGRLRVGKLSANLIICKQQLFMYMNLNSHIEKAFENKDVVWLGKLSENALIFCNNFFLLFSMRIVFVVIIFS